MKLIGLLARETCIRRELLNLKNVRRLWPRVMLALCSILLFASIAPSVNAAASSVTLAWNPSAGPNIINYKVYYGGVSRTYTNGLYTGNVTNATISGLLAGSTYFFAVTAFNSSLESDYSTEISYTVPNGTSTNPPPVTNVAGLVAAYAFDEGTGTTVADASGKGNVGSISGATWVNTGHFGKALSFNGTSSAIVINDAASLDLTTGMTLEAWVYPTSLSDWHEILYKGDDAYYLEASTPVYGPSVGIGNSFTNGVLSGPSPLTANTWAHLAATYDGTTLRLYVNGVQVTSHVWPGPIPSSSYPMTIGADTLHGSYFAGLIDEVRVYNRALSAAEIQTDLNTPITRSTSNTPPAIVLTSPTDGSSYAAPATINLSANVVTNGHAINKVQFYNGSSLLAEDNAPPYTYTWTNVAGGNYSVSARLVYDTSSTLNSSVANINVAASRPPPPPLPAITLTTPVDGSSFTAPATINLAATVTTNGHTINKVQFYNASSLIGESTSPPYTFSWNNVPIGSYDVIARLVYDNTGYLDAWDAFIDVNAPAPPLSFAASAGTITAPFTVVNGVVSQAVETGVTTGGRAVYNVTITVPGDYMISTVVNAPSESANSFYVNIDGEPTDPTMIWDIPVTTGFTNRLVSWRGKGNSSNSQYVPIVFTLSAGTHQVIVRGREANTQL